MTLLYVAGKYAGDIEKNIEIAEKTSIELIKRGFFVITPHKNTSGYGKYEGVDGITNETWMEMDFDMISRCDGLYVMVNYTESEGTLREIQFAKENDIPIIYESDCPTHTMCIGDIVYD